MRHHAEFQVYKNNELSNTIIGREEFREQSEDASYWGLHEEDKVHYALILDPINEEEEEEGEEEEEEEEEKDKVYYKRSLTPIREEEEEEEEEDSYEQSDDEGHYRWQPKDEDQSCEQYGEYSCEWLENLRKKSGEHCAEMMRKEQNADLEERRQWSGGSKRCISI
ncbi:hypothetical protein M441DRAFT_43975 [Trichoderma asperellum CBS 433.97]|uniref:Uncharacterized protein n=1 Tax=Trichoderma asperellum (strain ATCC 204424 / CBS 433.97 / NBRC 101777) TaxID=1042311 RepID=A0A2T3ZGA7_TRIA4|nr:hypothetical protein M441DRAFT_43975 [Trichoderma asperellum CBS 433.97]PTB43842.1 hypothetical protein M441DRAFT_43975 [Trichoderma asperellum CBS 433.97]